MEKNENIACHLKKHTQHPSSLVECVTLKGMHFPKSAWTAFFYVLFEQKFASVKLKIDYRKIPALENKNVRSETKSKVGEGGNL